jgi:hypothetical protein
MKRHGSEIRRVSSDATGPLARASKRGLLSMMIGDSGKNTISLLTNGSRTDESQIHTWGGFSGLSL